jgi:zinc and cadmium transporter
VAHRVERAVGDQGEDADQGEGPGAASAIHEAGIVTVFLWIVLGGVVMSAIALVGNITLVLRPSTLEKVLLPLVAFAAGSMIGGALFHMLPASLVNLSAQTTFAWVAAGFAFFFALEQFLHWHHCHRASAQCRKPLTYLVLVGDGLHNFLGGLAIAGVFLVDIRLGIAAWLAAAAHEVPQELGDFAVLIHGGWKRRSALLFNLLSGSTFLVGGLVAYAGSKHFEVGWLVPLAAGNFLYIGASDLVPEVNKGHSLGTSIVHFACFLGGLGGLYALAGLTH